MFLLDTAALLNLINKNFFPARWMHICYHQPADRFTQPHETHSKVLDK